MTVKASSPAVTCQRACFEAMCEHSKTNPTFSHLTRRTAHSMLLPRATTDSLIVNEKPEPEQMTVSEATLWHTDR
jgi:hypothetical protein